MTIAVLTDRTLQGEEPAKMVSRWMRLARRHRQLCFVVAPAAFDLPERSGLRHVAAQATEADELAALADVAGECTDQLWLVDLRGQTPATWSDAISIPASKVSACAALLHALAVRELANTGQAHDADAGPLVDIERALRAAGISDDDAPKPGSTYEGWYARRVVSYLADPLAARALRIDAGPASVTVVNLAAILAAALLACAGTWLALALAGVLVQVAVVFTCVHGEVVARGGRQSAFGGWFHRITRPIVLLALLAGLGIGLDELGQPLWLSVALAAALVTGAELMTRSSATAMSDRQSAKLWSPPQSEVLLAVSVALLTGSSGLVVVLIAGISLVITLATAIAFVLRPAREPMPAYLRRKQRSEVARDLFEQSDPGPLSTLVGREDPHLSLLRRLAASSVGPFLPWLTWFIEAVALIAVVRWQNEELLPLAFVLIAVLAFHRSDISARRTYAESPPAAWTFLLSLGALGRPVLYLVLAATDSLNDGLIVATIGWAVLFAVDAAAAFADPEDSKSQADLDA